MAVRETKGDGKRETMKVRRLFQLLTLATVLLGLSTASFAQVSIGIAVNLAPPALPVYEQPICPDANYIWTPGYWAWNGYDYYWVPGTWVQAPSYGLLWTPGYWGWGTGGYFWHTGYWGPHIGFYGGVNYGYGYFGRGFEGGYWHGNSFYYNTAVSRVNTRVIRNVYVNKTVINNVTVNNRVSYNGGRGGIDVRPSTQEQTAYGQRRMGPVGTQTTHERVAQQDRANFFKANNGVPAHAALARPAANVNDFNRNAVAAHGARPVEANNNARPETRPAPTQAQRPNTSGARPEQTARPETRPAPTQQQRPVTSTARPAQESRPSVSARPEERPQPQSRPAPQSHPESQPRPSEPHGDEHPHP
jgi:WXXGXW repeat (2 copies)